MTVALIAALNVAPRGRVGTVDASLTTLSAAAAYSCSRQSSKSTS